MVLWKFGLRHVLQRPGRAILTLLSIVIAVAAVTSVSIATSTTRVAYREMFATVTGRAKLEVTAEGGAGYDQRVLDLVLETPGVKAAVPVLQRPTIMYANGQRVKLMALGIDPEKDQAIRDYVIFKGSFFLHGDRGVLLEVGFARNMGIKVGDQVKLLTRSGLRRITVTGVLSAKGMAAMQLAGLMFMPIDEAQNLFAARGRIDSIQIVLDDSADPETVCREIVRCLPAGINVGPPATQSRFVEETLESSEQGLRLASAFSLLLAMFVILNTFMMNVGERRKQLAIMRAIGATRRQLAWLLIGESLVMGVIGTALGSLAGLGGAYLLTWAMSQLLMSTLPPMQVTPLPFVVAAIAGLGVAVLGAAIPARRAGKLSPLEGLANVTLGNADDAARRSAIAGAIITLVSGTLLLGCIFGWLSIHLAATMAVFLLIGIVLLTPIILGALAHAAMWIVGPLLHVEGRLAHRQILRHRTRSSLTAGVLFIASATGVGLACAILDSVQDVRQWYKHVIVGDFFIRAMMPDMATGMSPDLPDELGREIRQVPGITNVDTGRFVKARAEGQPVIVIVREFTSPEPVYFDLKAGDPKQIRQELSQGEVVIGTVLAQRTGLKQGDQITLETLQGPKKVRIAGLTNEYLVGGLAIYMERNVAKRLLGVEGVDAYIIHADPKALRDVQTRLEALTKKYGVLLHSFVDLRSLIDGMVTGIDGCLWGILVLGFLVASFGVVNTLTMNVLEQTRELGLLRIVAMTRWQVRKTILGQAAIIAAIGVVPGVLSGVGVAYLISLGTTAATGHTVAFTFRPLLMVTCFVGALAVVLLSALVPTERAARIELAKALQYE
ncbi:MAG: FtsX-like permease family protein [Planctomycetia bacterium]|nr:FtsX-like permease family protein [Planctomycetia bacterium]